MNSDTRSAICKRPIKKADRWSLVVFPGADVQAHNQTCCPFRRISSFLDAFSKAGSNALIVHGSSRSHWDVTPPGIALCNTTPARPARRRSQTLGLAGL